jgi:hypothetical protein
LSRKPDPVARWTLSSLIRLRIARIFAILTLTALLATPRLLLAQTPAASLERLDVDIWPDYDAPSVLVIMNGTLPDGAPLPATVTLPLPGDASLNAVARVTADNMLFADISYDESVPGQLTLTAPEKRFRIEYYVPYEADGNQRNFTFDWRSDMTVLELFASVQQPFLAEDVTLTPAAASVNTRQDGLQYHDLPLQSVPEGGSFSLEGAYTLQRPGLTVDFLETQQPGQNAPSPTITNEPAGAAAAAAFNWPLALAVMGVVLAIGAVAWLVISGRRSPSRRVTKPRPVRRAKAKPISKTAGAPSPSKARFCHECGQPASPEDRFCSHCGTALKELT